MRKQPKSPSNTQRRSRPMILGTMARLNGRAGRYSLEAAAVEIRAAMSRYRDDNGEQPAQKFYASLLDVSEGQFSHKLRMTGKNRFSVEEVGVLADFFGAPTGWPWIRWSEAEERDRLWAAHVLSKPRAR